MKKLIIILLFTIVILLSGCANKVVPNDGKITLYLDEEFTQYMKYDEVPSFTLTFEGNINTIEHVGATHYTIFASNDDFKLSEILAELLEKYEDRIYIDLIEVSEDQDVARINSRDENGEVTRLSYPVDDGKVYYEDAYIKLENGLQLGIDYRRFVNEGKDYYVWREKNNISMILAYPMMVIEIDGEKELILTTLPIGVHRTKYGVGPNLRAENLINDDSYLEDAMYTFLYMENLETIEEKQQYVIDYYVDYHDGYVEDNKIYFEYLNIKFLIILNDDNFVLRFVEKLS